MNLLCSQAGMHNVFSAFQHSCIALMSFKYSYRMRILYIGAVRSFLVWIMGFSLCVRFSGL